jgi:hypothetical protein
MAISIPKSTPYVKKRLDPLLLLPFGLYLSGLFCYLYVRSMSISIECFPKKILDTPFHTVVWAYPKLKERG